VHNEVPWRNNVVDEGFTADENTRTVTPNTKPGLGVTLNKDEVKKYSFEQQIPQRVFYQDDSVGDW